MTDLVEHLERLGLEQYLNAFEGEGFDTWETLLDIQESDLEALGVKLGHRRKLQRAIADFRGISYERLVGSPGQEGSVEVARHVDGSPAVPTGSATAAPTETKRRYRRHPRPDDNAPEKPPSAYVLFSNRVREDVQGDNLSFTEIAKLVGEKWQKLDYTQKEPFESRASAMKEQYSIQLSAYKKTDAYAEYAQYLADFKAKHNQESKRPRLDAQSSGGSMSAASGDPSEMAPLAAVHAAAGGELAGHMSAASSTTAFPSPGSVIHGPSSSSTSTSTSLPTLSASLSLVPPVNAPRPASPTWSHIGRDRRPPTLHSAYSSISDDAVQPRSDVHDPLPRTAGLTIQPSPTVTPPLSVRLEHGSHAEAYARSIRPPTTLGSATQPVQASHHFPSRGTDPLRSPASSGNPLTMSLPSLLMADRLPDVGRGHAQRTLPPLRPPPGATHPPPGFAPSLPPMAPRGLRGNPVDGQLVYHSSAGAQGSMPSDDDTPNIGSDTSASQRTRHHRPR